MATGNMILMDDWVPHIREPSYENRSKLADVVKKLSMRGNILMARVITRDQALSVTTRESMLSTVQNWTRPEWESDQEINKRKKQLNCWKAF